MNADISGETGTRTDGTPALFSVRTGSGGSYFGGGAAPNAGEPGPAQEDAAPSGLRRPAREAGWCAPWQYEWMPAPVRARLAERGREVVVLPRRKREAEELLRDVDG